MVNMSQVRAAFRYSPKDTVQSGNTRGDSMRLLSASALALSIVAFCAYESGVSADDGVVVIEDFESLLAATDVDFGDIYRDFASETALPPEKVLETDHVFHRGTQEYFRAKR